MCVCACVCVCVRVDMLLFQSVKIEARRVSEQN